QRRKQGSHEAPRSGEGWLLEYRSVDKYLRPESHSRVTTSARCRAVWPCAAPPRHWLPRRRKDGLLLRQPSGHVLGFRRWHWLSLSTAAPRNAAEPRCPEIAARQASGAPPHDASVQGGECLPR